MFETEFIYEHNGVNYPVIVQRKKMRSIRYRFKDGTFYISCPKYLVTKKILINGLDRFSDSLLKQMNKEKPEGDGFYYILGHRISVLPNGGEITFTDGSAIKYKDKKDFDKKIRKWFLDLITKRTRYYESVMGVKPYNVHVRNMSTRYGSNSLSTRSINYALLLVHYPLPVIDSVVVHELAHDKVRDHSKKFYDVVYKYFPDYKLYHTKLRKGIFHD